MPIRGERLDNGGQSAVTLRVVNVLPYNVLKIFAFQDRHGNKDAYDLVFTLLNHQAGPRAAGLPQRPALSPDTRRSARLSPCSAKDSPI